MDDVTIASEEEGSPGESSGDGCCTVIAVGGAGNVSVD